MTVWLKTGPAMHSTNWHGPARSSPSEASEGGMGADGGALERMSGLVGGPGAASYALWMSALLLAGPLLPPAAADDLRQEIASTVGPAGPCMHGRVVDC